MDIRTQGAGVNAVTPGKTYTSSAWVRTNLATSPPVTCYIVWVDAANANISTVTAVQTVAASGAWVRYTASAVAPPLAVRAIAIFRIIPPAGAAVGNLIDLAGPQFETGPTATAFLYGSAPTAGPLSYGWAGAANASASTEVFTQTAAVDADFTTLTAATNLLLDPGAEVVTANWATGGGNTLSRTTTQFRSGLSSAMLTQAAAGGAVYLHSSGTAGINATVGQIYTAAAYVRSNTAGATATVTTRFIDSANALLRNDTTVTPVAVPTAGWAQVAVTSGPAPANTAKVVVYVSINGSASGRLWYVDDATLFAGDGFDTGGLLIAPFNGDTADTSLYRYDWTGATNASSSTRTPQFDRPPSLLTLTPGEDLWSFLSPLLTAAGLRLFCDEGRVWRLIDSTYTVAGAVSIAQGVNATSGNDTISRDNTGDWYDAVVVEYSWNDATTGLPKLAYDVASAAGWSNALQVKYARPYPGPGAAAYILKKATGKGRVLTPAALSDYAVTPSQGVMVNMPDTPVQTGVVSAVTWNMGGDEMEVKSRGLTDTGPYSYAIGPVGYRYADVPAGMSYSGFHWP
jgi:hypothetical protein